MSDDERDTFLAEERTCRVATVGANGPHVAPLWFVWHDGCVWLNSLSRSQRWTDVQRDPRVSIVVDAGEQFTELRGVEISGTAAQVGEVPRTGEAVPELDPVEAEFSRKYGGGGEMAYDGRHAWLVVRPTKIVSWDFRKNFG